jgi:hypothetical protein
LFVTVTPFTVACAAFTNLACIPQQGTSDQLDSLGDRLMFRLAYRNFGADESLVVNHAAKTSVAASGVRWYEIRSPNATPVVLQHGTLTSGSTSLWMGSIAMDKVWCIDVTDNGGRFLQLSALEAVQVSVHSTLDNYATGLQVGADTPLRPDSKGTVE